MGRTELLIETSHNKQGQVVRAPPLTHKIRTFLALGCPVTPLTLKSSVLAR